MSVSVKKNGVVSAGGNGINENIIANSAYINGSTPWNSWGTATDRTLVNLNGEKWLHFKNSASAYGGYSQNSYSRSGYTDAPILPNTSWTVSATWFASQPLTCIYWFHMRSSEGGANLLQLSKTIPVTTEPTRFSYTFNTGSNASYTIDRICLLIGAYSSNTTGDIDVYFKDVKIEAGSVLTPWCPHSQDEIYVSSSVPFTEVGAFDHTSFGSDYITANEFYEY